MRRFFSKLGWIPCPEESNSMLGFLSKKKITHNYEEMCRAAIEGWVPFNFWVRMHQTLAGLGQLLNEEKDKKNIATYIDEQVSDYNSTWRVTD
jgi:hypothetical protein